MHGCICKLKPFMAASYGEGRGRLCLFVFGKLSWLSQWGRASDACLCGCGKRSWLFLREVEGQCMSVDVESTSSFPHD